MNLDKFYFQLLIIIKKIPFGLNGLNILNVHSHHVLVIFMLVKIYFLIFFLFSLHFSILGCTKDIQVTFKTNKPTQLNKEKVLCSITKITFDRPTNEIPDWDDRMRSIKWIDSVPSTAESINPDTQRTNRPARRKVVEADIEPTHQRIEEQTRLLDIYISAIADYCRYKCSDFEIRYYRYCYVTNTCS